MEKESERVHKETERTKTNDFNEPAYPNVTGSDDYQEKQKKKHSKKYAAASVFAG